MKKVLLVVFFALIIGVVYILATTYTQPQWQKLYHSETTTETGDYAQSVAHLSKALTHPTVSHAVEMLDTNAFDGLLHHMSATYPKTFAHVVDTFGTHSLLFFIEGSNLALKPALFMGHMDVVPAVSPQQWASPPFEGKIIKDSLYGRGTLDDKLGVFGLLEAFEHLADQQPKRSLYLAFGQDEEIGGSIGAKAIAQYLESEKIEFEFVLDEGGVLGQDLIPGIEGNVALIGIAEKGFLSVNLSTRYPGGHSSMPELENAITIIADAITALQAHPLPAEFSEPIKGFMAHLGPELPFTQRMAFAHPSIFGSIIEGVYDQSASGRSLIHTTMAPTIFRGGIKDNIIPNQAQATLNFRILPGVTKEDLVEYVEKTINDPRITITTEDDFALAEGIADYSHSSFIEIGQAISETYPGTLITPYLTVGATDGRHFTQVSKNVYRFLPVPLGARDLKRLHGRNERIWTQDVARACQCYERILVKTSY
mgnify:CR=1 FL=1